MYIENAPLAVFSMPVVSEARASAPCDVLSSELCWRAATNMAGFFPDICWFNSTIAPFSTAVPVRPSPTVIIKAPLAATEYGPLSVTVANVPSVLLRIEIVPLPTPSKTIVAEEDSNPSGEGNWAGNGPGKTGCTAPGRKLY